SRARRSSTEEIASLGGNNRERLQRERLFLELVGAAGVGGRRRRQLVAEPWHGTDCLPALLLPAHLCDERLRCARRWPAGRRTARTVPQPAGPAAGRRRTQRRGLPCLPRV